MDMANSQGKKEEIALAVIFIFIVAIGTTVTLVITLGKGTT